MNKGDIKAQDFNINILMNPPHYRIDNLPEKFKEKIIASLSLEKSYLHVLRIGIQKIVVCMAEISYVELVFRRLCMFQGF